MEANKKKLIFIILGIVLVVVAIIGAILILKAREPIGPTPIESGENPIEAKDYAETIQVDSYSINNTTDQRNINVRIPVIKNLKNYSFQESINKAMSSIVQDYENEISIVIDEETPEGTVYRYYVSYDRHNNDNYLSFVISQNYQAGGMRSNAWKDVFNIDAYQCKQIFLADIFPVNVNYKEAIIEEINRQAVEKNYELVGGNGISNIPDKQKFYIQDRKLWIYFDPAEVAPYVYGEMHFEMPFSYKDGYFYIEEE